MGKYIKLFDTHAQYESYTADTQNFILPNVSYCVDTPNEVHYNPYVAPPETRVVVKYDVIDTANPTKILNSTFDVNSAEVDSVALQSVETGYTFSTTGEHVVKYEIGKYNSQTFEQCDRITSVIIPSSIEEIGTNGFYKCTNLTGVTLLDGITEIRDQVFQYTKIANIDIPDSVTRIGMGAFYECDSLTSCTIGSGITNIGMDCFGSSRLKTLTVNAITPPTLGSGVFRYVGSLEAIYVPSGSVETYKAASGWSDYASIIQPIA